LHEPSDQSEVSTFSFILLAIFESIAGLTIPLFEKIFSVENEETFSKFSSRRLSDSSAFHDLVAYRPVAGLASPIGDPEAPLPIPKGSITRILVFDKELSSLAKESPANPAPIIQKSYFIGTF